MAANEAFSGAQLWDSFDEACAKAETVRVRAVEEAVKERDRVLNALCAWNAHAPDRIKAAAIARWEGKTKAAQDNLDAACRSAEAELMKGLDELEKASGRLETH